MGYRQVVWSVGVRSRWVGAVAEVARLQAVVRDTGPRRTVRDGLPLLVAMQPLLSGRVKRGGVVAIEGRVGRLSLAMAMLAGVSAAGGWCGVVGIRSFGAHAGADLGIRLERLGVVAEPGAAWAEVVAALVAGMDAVLVDASTPVGGRLARGLAAKARQHYCTLFTLGPVWEGSDVRVSVLRQEWFGLQRGRGRMRSRQMTVAASHRPHDELMVWLPDEEGRVWAVDNQRVTRTTAVGGRARAS